MSRSNESTTLDQYGHSPDSEQRSELQRSELQRSELQRQLQTAPRESANVEHRTFPKRILLGSDTRPSKKRPCPAKDLKSRMLRAGVWLQQNDP